jgi:hypothetical protein
MDGDGWPSVRRVWATALQRLPSLASEARTHGTGHLAVIRREYGAPALLTGIEVVGRHHYRLWRLKRNVWPSVADARSRTDAPSTRVLGTHGSGRLLSSLTHKDLLIYQRILAKPQLAEKRVMAPGGRRDPGWRPFVGLLFKISIRRL